MNLDVLTAVSPIDGRYRGKTESLANYFSEYALIKYRIRVEIEYFITLCELPLPQLADFNHAYFEPLRDIYRKFDEAGAARVKEIEKVTNHDVKAVEYYIKEQIDKIGDFEKYKEFIHFGLTSQDINNTSVPLSIRMHSMILISRSSRSSSTFSSSMPKSGKMCLCLQRPTASQPLQPVLARR